MTGTWPMLSGIPLTSRSCRSSKAATNFAPTVSSRSHADARSAFRLRTSFGSILEMRRNGIKEVHLIGQNVNSYRPLTDSGLEGFAGATPFSRLMRAVAATGIERVKFNTSFPRDFHPDIVDAINEHENLCNWVHLAGAVRQRPHS